MSDGQISQPAPQSPGIDSETLGASVARDFTWSHSPGVSRAKHPTLIIALHWGCMLAIVISVAAMFVRDAIEDQTWRQVLLHIHRQLGLLVLIVVAWRIALRLRKSLADHAPDMAAVFRWAAKATHVVLYALLIALSVGGWACTNAHAISLSLLGVLPLPDLMSADSEVADTLSDYHILLSWVLLASVAVHAIAALWHHYVRRDAVLSAMLPGRQ